MKHSRGIHEVFTLIRVKHAGGDAGKRRILCGKAWKLHPLPAAEVLFLKASYEELLQLLPHK